MRVRVAALFFILESVKLFHKIVVLGNRNYVQPAPKNTRCEVVKNLINNNDTPKSHSQGVLDWNTIVEIPKPIDMDKNSTCSTKNRTSCISFNSSPYPFRVVYWVM